MTPPTAVNASILSFVDPSNPGANVTISGSGTANSANVGNSIAITNANIGSLALGGADAGSYNINTIAINGYLTVSIEPKPVNVSELDYTMEQLTPLPAIYRFHLEQLEVKH